jgi:hypothetical protein
VAGETPAAGGETPAAGGDAPAGGAALLAGGDATAGGAVLLAGGEAVAGGAAVPVGEAPLAALWAWAADMGELEDCVDDSSQAASVNVRAKARRRRVLRENIGIFRWP